MKTPFKKNRGMVTLLTAIVILVLLSIMVIFAAKVGVFDQRMTANEARYKEAFTTAETGLDFAIQRFDNKFRQTGAGAFSDLVSMQNIVAASQIASGTKADGTSAGSGEASFGVVITPNPPATLDTVYTVVSTGVGADGTGTATIQRQISVGKTLGRGAPDVPVMVKGVVGTSGNYNIAANPNGGGPGVPVAIWTPSPAGTISLTGSSATCHLEYYDGNNAVCANPSDSSKILSKGTNPVTPITAYNLDFPDVLPNDPKFPSDLFEYLFDVARGDWATIKAKAANHNQVINGSNCNQLSATAGAVFALWWVNGNCTLGSTQIIGSLDKPVILVIDDSVLTTPGGTATIYGIAYIFDNPDNVATPSVVFNGSPQIYGGLVTDVGGAAMDGSYSIVYVPSLFDNLVSEDSRNYDLAYIPGSWRDYE